MAGKYRGAAVTIQSKCPKAVYVHCAAHALNLCVVAACSVQLLKNMMGTMVEICLFFSNSPKRQLELEKIIQSGGCTTAKKLVSLCKTRWIARIDALEVFLDLFPAVVKTLDVINPRRACARVTVLVLSVCVCVCVFSLFWHLAQSGVQTAVSATSARYGHEI